MFVSFNSVQLVPFHDSLIDELGLPVIAKAAVLVPVPAIPYLAVFRSPTSVQLDPFHNSLTATGAPVKPPKANAFVLLDPAPPPFLLAVFKSVVSVQLVPFHDSLIDELGLPVIAKAAVLVPVPAIPYLAVFRSPTSVQLDPFHNSLTATGAPV